MSQSVESVQGFLSEIFPAHGANAATTGQSFTTRGYSVAAVYFTFQNRLQQTTTKAETNEGRGHD